MRSVWPEAEKWPKKCNVEIDPMHGGTFNGNGCRRLLKSTDILQAEANFAAQPFVAVYKSLNVVVNACFGIGLNQDYKNYIDDFKVHFLDLVELGYVNVTPKIHAIFHHVHEFCSKEGVGLGRFSEQASESVHNSFKTIFLRCERGISNPEYGAQLLKAVKDYNCSHI